MCHKASIAASWRFGRYGKGTANRARAGFRRALADAKLHALKTQSPNAYRALTLQAETAQRATRLELRKYLLSGNGRGRLAKALTVKLFGVIDPIRTGRSGTLPAAHLGLSEYGNRSDAIEDTALLLAEIAAHNKGYRGTLNATKSELRKARAALTRAKSQGFSLGKLAKGARMRWGHSRRREVHRAEARAALHQIRLERLNSLRAAFRL